MNSQYRTLTDSLGEVRVPMEALYGAQTQRAIDNFRLSELKLPPEFIRAIALGKKIAAEINMGLELLDRPLGEAIVAASKLIIEGQYQDQFPVDVFQTGSATSTHLNVNEVIASLASKRSNLEVSALDHVNLGQSSNDSIPTAIHVSAALLCHQELLPAINTLELAITKKAEQLQGTLKTGRTHLMDALPIPMSEELRGWASQIKKNRERLMSSLQRVYQIAQGGTAVGTGVNAHPEFSQLFAERLAAETGLPFKPNESMMEALSCQDTMVEFSAQLKVLAIGLFKIANDLRWMNSGPWAGLHEIELVALQPGSSIMPGKINPVIPEATMMVVAQVIGNDAAISFAGASGNFQLNTMLPLIAYQILQSVSLLAKACLSLGEKAMSDFVVQTKHLQTTLSLNPILVTVLTPLIGYEQAAAIAKRAYQERRPILEVAIEMTSLDRHELERRLDPRVISGAIIEKS